MLNIEDPKLLNASEQKLFTTAIWSHGFVKPCATAMLIGKLVPLQAWSGPEDSRNLRFPDFMTKAQGGSRVVNLTHRPPLPPGNQPGTISDRG